MLSLSLLVFAPISLALTVIDLRTHRLPNRLVGLAFISGSVLLAVDAMVASKWDRYASAAAASLALSACYLLLRWLSRNGLGLGDVKLAAVLGLYLGYLSWTLVLTASLIALLAAGITTSIGLAVGQMSLKSRVPFGPFMLLGFWLVLIPIDSAFLGRWVP